MILRYTRTDGRRTPAAFEQVELDDDGRMIGWRSVSAPAVGSFVGAAPAEHVTRARQLAAAVAQLPDPAGVPRPVAPTELIEVGDRLAVSVSGVDASDDPAWRELTELARALVEVVVNFPHAAVALDFGEHVRLVHRGSATLDLDLSHVEVAGSWQGALTGPATVTAGPGWSYELGIGALRAGGADIEAQLSVTFGIVQGERVVAVEVTDQPGRRYSVRQTSER
jgi:hypothetical protein